MKYLCAPLSKWERIDVGSYGSIKYLQEIRSCIMKD